MTNMSNVDSNQVIDVAIVGGGVSGAYVAWRLAASTDLKVHLYELSDRIGGRLLSVTMPEMPHIHAEFGGMFFSESQAIVSKLIKDILKLKVVPATYEEPNNLFYARNKHLRLKDLSDPLKVPYNLRPEELGKGSDDLFAYAIEQAINQGEPIPPDYFNSDQWKYDREHLKVEGNHLYNISIWDLLLKFLSQEAYSLCLDSGLFYSDLGTWNAAQAIETNMSVPYDDQWLTIENGYEQLPKALAAEFQQHGGKVLFRHRLSEFERHGLNGLIELSFVDVETKRAYPKVLAKHLVLAMPKRSIELLYPQNKDNFLFSNSTFRQNLQTVTADPAYKLFLGYDYPWWHKLDVKQGFSSTDLPIRQCIYRGTEGESGGDPNNRKSLLQANYADSRAASFWSTMQYEPYEPTKHRAFESRSHVEPLSKSFLQIDGTSYNEPLRASRNIVRTAQQQLKALHNLGEIPEPYSALYLDWGKDPYGGGWHSWNPHCRPWDIMKQIRHPVENANVYICGEAYSNRQGWVQGALNSAELMIEENFHLDRPDWLPAWYNLGS